MVADEESGLRRPSQEASHFSSASASSLGVSSRGVQRPVTSMQVNRGGHRHLKRPPKDLPMGFEGLWWVYAPTPKVQKGRMAQLSKPKKQFARFEKDDEAPPRRALDWVIRQAKRLPGPGQYDPKTDSRLRYFGAFNESKPKSELEWCIYRGKSMPGPGSYSLSTMEKIPGGRITEVKAKTSIDWVQYYARGLPGPADYQTSADANQIPGGRFNMSKTKSELEWVVHYAKEKPGPGSYDVRMPPSASGGRFSTSRPKTAVEWEIYRARQCPGPGDYDMPDLASRAKRGGGQRFSESNPKSDLDWKMLSAAESPGPGSYDPRLPGTFGNAFSEDSSLASSGFQPHQGGGRSLTTSQSSSISRQSNSRSTSPARRSRRSQRHPRQQQQQQGGEGEGFSVASRSVAVSSLDTQHNGAAEDNQSLASSTATPAVLLPPSSAAPPVVPTTDVGQLSKPGVGVVGPQKELTSQPAASQEEPLRAA